MDLALDSSVVFALLFTFLALFLASIFIRRRGGGPGAAAAAPGDEGNRLPEGEGSRLPVEEVGAGEEAKEAAAEQREEAAEPSPAAPSIPSATPSIPSESSIPSATPSIPSESSIPSAAPSIPSASSNAPAAPSIPPAAPSIPSASSVPSAAPSIPAPKEDAESKIPPLDASPESSLGHTGQAEGGCDHAELSTKAEEEDPDSENEKLVVREPEDEEATDETFSFKYSPGKLRGNQYKSMMTKEELEEEQRTEDYMKLSLASS